MTIQSVCRRACLAIGLSLLVPAAASAQKLVTAPGPGAPPSVRVVDASGTDRSFFAYDPAFLGGVRVALGDVNGDGVLDIVTGAGPGGGPHVRIWDGVTLGEIGGFFAYHPAFPGGVNVAAGDVNGDGRADIITGAGPGGGPHVRVWDGATFTEIAGFFAYNPAFPGGVSVAAGDVDGDGLADVVTGAGPGGGPHVRVWSGADFHEIGGFFAYSGFFAGGVNVAAGDIDGDGLADIVTGAGPGGGPHVRIWSGADFHEIGGFFAYSAAFPGGVTVGLTDLNRDGQNEIITGPMNGLPVVRLFTGTTFQLFGEYLAFDSAGGGSGVFIGSVAENPSTDDAPRVESTVPANGATGVAVDADLTVTFSEAVTAGPGAFLLECPAGTAIPLAISASPATTFTLNPTAPLPANTSCTLRIVRTEITDEDTDDPPDSPTANTTVTFTTSACPTITVTPTTVTGGIINVAYAPVTFSQVGGTTPITWTISAGTLPTGMTLSAAGVLSGTPTQSGAFPITVTATDANGCSGSVSLTLNIATAPNVAPSFTAGPNQTVLEDAGAQTVANWATAISPGPPAEAAQVVTFEVTGNTNPTLFSAGPSVASNGTLTYTSAANANGTATITLVLHDNGGTANGGVDTSAPQTFTITVTAVNDAPSFTVGPNQTVSESSGAHTVNPWATAIAAGPADEAAQTLTFNVTGNTNAALFSVAPAVSPAGVLTYTLAASASGTATITLTLSDNGGIANGGVNTSAPQTFTITVTGVDDPPTADNDTYTVAEGGTLSVPAPGVLDGDTDPEGDTPITAVLVTGPANASSFTLNSDGSFTYTHNGSETTTDTFTYRAVANGLQSAPATVTITITPVNDPPAITAGGTLNYTEGNPPTAIDTTITVTDPDTTNLAFATVQITGNYVIGQDVLEFTPALGISRVFVPATGTLTLSGSQPVANYQAALRSVTYVNTSATPSTAPRTVTWSVSDGSLSSNLATSTITVTAVNSAPIGVADAWTTFGNTDLVVDQAGPTTPFLADTTTSTFGVLDNDTDPEGDARVVFGIVGCVDTTAPFVCATTAGGSVTMESNGRFTYQPQAGDTGADSFQYVLRDVPSAGTPVNVNVTVNLTLQERIWYVDGNVAGPGTGTSSDPFNALPATVGDADDFIFVHDSTVSGGITLQNGQKLYGEGFGLSINQALNGNAAPAVIVPAGTNPIVNATAGNAVGVLANTASGNLANIEIRGLTLSTTAASSNAIDVTSANAANVAVTISGVTVTGATAEGIDINQGSTGTATVSLSNITVTSTGTGIDISETAGTLTVTGFSGLTVTGDSGGTGIIVTNATFDATPGGAYNQVAGGTSAVGVQANPVTGAGMVLTNVSGDLAFTDLDVFAAGGAGLQVTGTGAVNLGAGTGTSVAIASGAGTMQSTGGPVVNISNATADLTLAAATVTSSTTTGISLTTVNGTVAAPAGSIAGTTGISVEVVGGTVSLSYGGSITQTSNAPMVSVSGHTTGTITFSGTLNATNGSGLQFDNADSTTSYNFTGTTTLNGGDAGIDIVNSSGGTFSFGPNTTITNPTGTAFLLSGSTANVTYNGSISDNTGFAVDISGHPAGTVTFQTGSITSTGSGLQVSNNTGGTVNFNSPTIALTTGANKAVTLDVGNAGGTINFAPAGGNGLDISTTTGIGFSALGGGTISVSGASNTINSTGAMAIEIQNATIGAGGVNFASTTSGAGVRNVKLTSVTGSAIALGGGTLSGSTGAAFLVGDGTGAANTGGTSAITYGGSITSTGTARAVDIQDRAAGAGNITLSGTITHSTGNANVIFLDDNVAGTITFSGVNSVLNGGTSTAVSLTDNTGATINFTGGGLNIDATGATGAGFVATGGGNVNVTGANNTIDTTTSAALNVANTTIGPSGLTFQRIASNGAVNGILLNATGAGGLTVSGTGAADSGGTIQNSTADGVLLTSTGAVSFTQMNITSSGQSHIDATTVNGLSLTNVDTDFSVQAGVRGTNVTNLTISGGTFDRGGLANTICNFHGLDFTNLLGTSSVTGATFRRSNTIQFRVNNNTATNFSGTPDTLTVSGTTWNNHSQPVSGGTLCFGDHLSVNSDTGGNFRLIVNSSSGPNIVNAAGETNGGGIGVQATAGGTNGKMDASVTGLRTSNNTAGVVIGNTGTGATVTFNIFGNKTANGTGFSGTGSLALAVTHASTAGTTTGTIDDNSVTHTAGPGTNAMQIVLEGGGTVTARVSNNSVTGNFQRGLHTQSHVGTGTLNLTVNNNTLNGTDTTGTALQVFNIGNGGSGTGHGNTTCLNMHNNAVTFGPGATYTAAYRLIQEDAPNCTAGTCTFALQNFTGSGTNATDIQNWVTTTKSNTTGGNTVSVTVGAGFQTIASCPVPGS